MELLISLVIFATMEANENLGTLMSKVVQDFIGLEEKLITQVLYGLLRREPTIEDFKKTTKFQQEGCLDEYFLIYDNFKLGTVKKNFDFENGKVGLEFIPFGGDHFLKQATKDGKVTF